VQLDYQQSRYKFPAVARQPSDTDQGRADVQDLLLFFMNVLALQLRNYDALIAWLHTVWRPGPGLYAVVMSQGEMHQWLLTPDEEVKVLTDGVWECMVKEALADMAEHAAATGTNNSLPVDPVGCACLPIS
jgi:hypothetical protein